MRRIILSDCSFDIKAAHLSLKIPNQSIHVVLGQLWDSVFLTVSLQAAHTATDLLRLTP